MDFLAFPKSNGISSHILCVLIRREKTLLLAQCDVDCISTTEQSRFTKRVTKVSFESALKLMQWRFGDWSEGCEAHSMLTYHRIHHHVVIIAGVTSVV